MKHDNYTLVGMQIIGSNGCVAAELHGLGTVKGRERAALILAALNAAADRQAALMSLMTKARAYAASGTATDDDVRGLAHLLTQLIAEVAQ